MVKRATQFFSNDESLNERGMIVRAAGANCEKLVGLARENHVFITDHALEHFAIPQTLGRESLRQVRWLRIFHDTPPRHSLTSLAFVLPDPKQKLTAAIDAQSEGKGAEETTMARRS